MARESEARFAAYVEALSAALGHADRRGPFKELLSRSADAGRAQEPHLAMPLAVERTGIEHAADALQQARVRHRPYRPGTPA